MFRFWGDGSQEAMNLVQSIRVRSTDHFNWTFIFILSVVFFTSSLFYDYIFFFDRLIYHMC